MRPVSPSQLQAVSADVTDAVTNVLRGLNLGTHIHCGKYHCGIFVLDARLQLQLALEAGRWAALICCHISMELQLCHVFQVKRWNSLFQLASWLTNKAV